jgi:prepilin-type processing-associated H-X9-DG protein
VNYVPITYQPIGRWGATPATGWNNQWLGLWANVDYTKSASSFTYTHSSTETPPDPSRFSTASKGRAPSGTFLMSERASVWGRMGAYYGASDVMIWSVNNQMNDTGFTGTRFLHRGKLNYLFSDFHVETLKPADTIGRTGSLAYPEGSWTRMDD